MPQLPTAEKLGARIPQNRGGVVTGDIDLSGYQQLGQAAESFGANLKDRQDAMNLQKAKAKWQRAKIEADNAFDQDNDFATYTTRYNEMLQKAEEEAAGLIGNSRMQEAFKQEVSVYRAQGLEQMKDRAFEKERESGLATLDETLTILRESALRAKSPADQQFAFNAMNDAIAVAEEKTYIDEDDAQTLRRTKGQEMAVALVEVQDLKTQKELLTSKKGPAEIIPMDVRKSMLESVNSQLIDEEALAKADEIRLEGGGRSERLEKVYKIKDPDVRKAAESQVIHTLEQEKKAMAEGQIAILDEVGKAELAGTTVLQWKSQNAKKWDALTADQQKALLSGPGRTTDLAAYHRINMAFAESRDKGLMVFNEEAGKLSATHFTHFSNMLAKGPEQMDPLFTLNTEFGKKTGKTGLKLSDEAKGKAEELLAEEWVQFQQENPGKKPNITQQQEILNRVFDVVVEEKSFLGFGYTKETPRYEMTPEQRRRMDSDKAFQEDLSIFQEQADLYEQRTGRRLTPARADQMLETLKQQGIIREWGVRGSQLPINLQMDDGTYIDAGGNVTVSSGPVRPGEVPAP